MRSFELKVGTSLIPLPAFWPSISSVKTNAPPFEYLQILNSSKSPQFLISAYDIDRFSRKEKDTLGKIIPDYHKKNQAVMIDSGNYEKYWLKDVLWTRKRHNQVVRGIESALVTTYDKQIAHTSSTDASKDAIDSFYYLNRISESKRIIPIVHGTPESLPDSCRMVAKKVRPTAICIAERELGMGMLNRIKAIRTIRHHLNKLGAYYPIHVLGTGNPLSLMLFSAAGADSFDGLEWCQTSVDPRTGHLFHFQQSDLLTAPGDRPEHVKRFFISTLAGNLSFYKEHMEKIRRDLISGDIMKTIRKSTDKRAHKDLAAAFGGRIR